jgi:hypothetical protein
MVIVTMRLGFFFMGRGPFQLFETEVIQKCASVAKCVPVKFLLWVFLHGFLPSPITGTSDKYYFFRLF